MIRVCACLAGLMLVASCPVRAGEPQEPCYQFELEESFGSVDGPAQTRKRTCFTETELDWTPLDLVLESREDLEGFTVERTDAEFTFDGKAIKGQRVVWTRKLGEAANINGAAVKLSVSSLLPTPAFTLNFGRGPDLRVPAGCLALEVVPHPAGAAGVDDFEMKNTCAASGALGKALPYEMGNRTVAAHEFTYSTTSSDRSGKITLLLSRDVPGGLCSMTMEMNDKRRGKVKGIIRIVNMTPAPVPEKLEEFGEAGFAFAPPEGYSKAKEAKAGETVRYVTDKGAFIAVSVKALPKGGIKAVWDEQAAHDDGLVRSLDRAHHLAGHRTFTTWDEKANVGCIHGEHASRKYEVTISGFGSLTPKDASALLRGWRWLKTK